MAMGLANFPQNLYKTVFRTDLVKIVVNRRNTKKLPGKRVQASSLIDSRVLPSTPHGATTSQGSGRRRGEEDVEKV